MLLPTHASIDTSGMPVSLPTPVGESSLTQVNLIQLRSPADSTLTRLCRLNDRIMSCRPE